MILDRGFDLNLRPMKYPVFFEMYKSAIKNTWTVDEVDFSSDITDLTQRLSASERHLISRLVAFFATGDSIVSNNLVLNLYTHINSPEARMYLSRQLYEEALHVQFYLTLLDTYIPDHDERVKAFQAVENIPAIRKKAEFCFKWMNSIEELTEIRTRADQKQFLLNLVCFACCIEGLFFFGAFAYVYFLRSKGLLNGLATGTNWVFRDESCHIAFAFEVINTVRREDPSLFDLELQDQIVEMMKEAVDCETHLRRRRAGLGNAQGNVSEGHARLPRVRRRPPAGFARHPSDLRSEKSVRVHGTAGRAGTLQLLRASRPRRVSNGRDRRRGIH